VRTIGFHTRLLGRLTCMLLWLAGAGTAPSGSAEDADPGERGDVPGWVMITLMSAVLVAALLAIAGPALEGLFNQAMQKVSR
jgi:hypothetical protein